MFLFVSIVREKIKKPTQFFTTASTYDITSIDKSHDFQTSFAIFRILKSFGHTFVGAFYGQDVKNFFLFLV